MDGIGYKVGEVFFCVSTEKYYTFVEVRLMEVPDKKGKMVKKEVFVFREKGVDGVLVGDEIKMQEKHLNQLIGHGSWKVV